MNSPENSDCGIIGNEGMKQRYRQRKARSFDYIQRMETETVIARQPKLKYV